MAGRPGRREQPLDPGAGPLERFALGLRSLRGGTGLTYSEMADLAHFSPSTLSQAAAGQRLPSREVLRAYVRACGEDPHSWDERWEQVRLAVYGPETQERTIGDAPIHVDHAETNSFVGRERELATGGHLLQRCRLVTLVGTGGVGKTRLARRIVHEVAEQFSDGTYCAELADLSSDRAVTEAVASAFGVVAGARQDTLSALVEALRGRNVLLMLDNCEHVLYGCVRTVRDLLTRLPQLRILATSRQPLDVGAEHVLHVRPLGLPTLVDGSLHETGATDKCPLTSPAMTLFVDRAEAAAPGFRGRKANPHTIARVCQRLDGLPLALELAARRLRTLSLDELLERLDQRFRLLGPGGSDRTAHPRHLALRALFDWSYELCTEAERAAWQQLSLCFGGVLLTDAEQLCGGFEEGEVLDADATGDAFEALSGLVDKSLLTSVETDSRTRLHMLETVRAYGQERLRQSGRAQLALRRHRAWYLELAAQAGTAYGSSEQAEWLRRLRAEHLNLRQIVTAPPPTGEPAETVLRASLGFWLHCLTSANVGEGAHWMHQILQRHPRPPSSETTATWCRAAWVAGFLLLLHGDHGSADEVISRSEQVLADMPAASGTAHPGTHRATRAELTAAFLQLRSLAALVAGDTETAARHANSSLATEHWSVPLLTQQQCIAQLGFSAVLQGERTRSITLLEQALTMSEAQGNMWHRCYLLWALAVDHGEAGRPQIALQLLRRALQHTRKIDEHLGEAALSETLAWVLSSYGDARSAAVLLGAVDHVWHPSGTPRLFGFALLTAHRERGLENARRSLGDKEYTRAYQKGRRLGLRRALDIAIRDNEHLRHGAEQEATDRDDSRTEQNSHWLDSVGDLGGSGSGSEGSPGLRPGRAVVVQEGLEGGRRSR
ncbi:helix-turn-helix domain-containing protein [Streptomyces hirsutus]|uniref:ATP-binding protein n=1 Tax=Streptomyces hirsutus TaxID=35620 RepID=UPI003403550C